jgi:IclR family pca regulon transcriptional regulator
MAIAPRQTSPNRPARSAPAVSAKSTVLSLSKGLRVLESFTTRDPELSLSEVASRAGLDPGTTYRLIKTLVMLGYLRQIGGAKRYRLAMKVLDLGFHAIAGMDFHESSRPVLRSLVSEVNHAASLTVLDGGDILYVERVQAPWGRLGVNVRVGSRIPIYCAAAGHAILACLPPKRRREILAMRERFKLTPNTPVTLAELERRFALVRKLGYALSDQDHVPGLRVLAAPVLDPDGQPFGAVSVASPSVSGTLEAFVKSSAGPLGRAAEELSRILRISGAASAA